MSSPPAERVMDLCGSCQSTQLPPAPSAPKLLSDTGKKVSHTWFVLPPFSGCCPSTTNQACSIPGAINTQHIKSHFFTFKNFECCCSNLNPLLEITAIAEQSNMFKVRGSKSQSAQRSRRNVVAYLGLSKDTWSTADEARKVACMNL